MTTRWSVILAAGRDSTIDSRQALETLCETYWHPLYFYIRGRGKGVEEAEDLIQGFFAEILARDTLKGIRRDGGRFRSFLSTALRRFMANEWDKARASKRGGGQTPLSLDFETAENQFCLEPSHELTPEVIFIRRWAQTLLDRTYARLQASYEKRGPGDLFQKLKDLLLPELDHPPYRELAGNLGLTESALKSTIHRMRKSFGIHLRDEVSQTVARPKDWAKAQGGLEKVPLQTRLELIAQTAAALAAAHSVGVIHKDIKAANVLIAIDPAGRPRAVLADFGIGLITERSRLEEQGITILTELASGRTASTATGTRLYLAPELLAGGSPSIQSDVYSLGVLFHQLVVGDLSCPMTTDWERNVHDRLLRDDLHRCLAGDPADRFAGAADLALHIRDLPQRRRRRRAARFARVATGVLAILLVIIGGGLSFQLYQRKQAEEALARETMLRQEAEDARQQTEWQLYYSSIGLAASLIEERRYDKARESPIKTLRRSRLVQCTRRSSERCCLQF